VFSLLGNSPPTLLLIATGDQPSSLMCSRRFCKNISGAGICANIAPTMDHQTDCLGTGA